MSLSTKEDIQSLLANYRDVEMEKERAFVVNDNSPMETEPPVDSPSMSSPLTSHISNSILDSHTPSNPSAESPSSHSAESSPDVSKSLENAPSSSAIPPPLSDVRILNRINHRAIPPRLFVRNKHVHFFEYTTSLYTYIFFFIISLSKSDSPSPILRSDKSTTCFPSFIKSGLRRVFRNSFQHSVDAAIPSTSTGIQLLKCVPSSGIVFISPSNFDSAI